MGAMTPPSRKSCYNFRVVSIDKVVDGDTIDVSLGGTFAGDKFISITNRTRSNTTKR